jgi:cytochrome c peroxidase
MSTRGILNIAIFSICACVPGQRAALAGQDAAGPKTSSDPVALNEANPVQPLPQIPLGVLRTWDQLKDNKPEPARVRLGRWLYYDTRISADNTIACATCHQPSHAFTQDTPVSTGIKGQKGGRKAPTFLNAAWALFPHMFWDGRAASLEDQAKGPMTNPIEMGMRDHDLVVAKIAAITSYRPYFKEAFGDDKVTIDRIVKAIADYERTRLSGNSPWDRWQANMTDADRETIQLMTNPDPFGGAPPAFKDGKEVSAKVKLGHALFFGKAGCAQCHIGPNFTDTKFHNLGVGYNAKTQKFADEGRYVISKKDEDRGAFKTPTVREATKRAPFMHDGSEKTLMEVVEFYNKGGNKNAYLSPKVKVLNLTKPQKEALVEFMKALSGEGYMDTPPAVFPG